MQKITPYQAFGHYPQTVSNGWEAELGLVLCFPC